MGLATSFGIVRQHDGAIDVHSEPGLGTAFDIYLPSAKDRPLAPIAPVPDPKLPRRDGNRPGGGGRTHRAQRHGAIPAQKRLHGVGSGRGGRRPSGLCGTSRFSATPGQRCHPETVKRPGTGAKKSPRVIPAFGYFSSAATRTTPSPPKGCWTTASISCPSPSPPRNLQRRSARFWTRARKRERLLPLIHGPAVSCSPVTSLRER